MKFFIILILAIAALLLLIPVFGVLAQTSEAVPAATPITIPVHVAPVVITPEGFKNTAIEWITAAGVVLGVLSVFVTNLFGKIKELKAMVKGVDEKTEMNKERLDRHGETLVTLQGTGNGNLPNVPGASGTGNSGGIVSVLAACFGALFLMTSCATDQASVAARKAAWGQAGIEAANILGASLEQTLFDVAKSEATGKKVDFQQSGAAALWATVDYQHTASSIRNIYNAYSAAKTPATSNAVVYAYKTATENGQDPEKVINAIATVISTASGAPPAK